MQTILRAMKRMVFPVGASGRSLLLLAALCLQLYSVPVAQGAGGDPLWQYNPVVTGKQEALASAIDSQGSMILAGYVENATSDYYLAKILPNGSGLAWPAVTLDFAGAEDQATAVAVDGDDNIIVTGYVHNGSTFDIHTVKFSGASGSILWQHTFNGTGGGDDFAAAIAVDDYDNIYVGGTMQGASAKDDMVIIKYAPGGPNPDGTPAWSVSYNGPDGGHDRLSALAVSSAGIAVTGESQNAALNFDLVIVKFTLDHQQLWDKRYADAGNGKGLAVAMDTSGNVVATGYVDGGAGRDRYTVKYPSAGGAFLWEKIRDLGDEDEGRALWLDGAGNVYVTGSSFSLTTQLDLAVTRYAAADGSFAAPNGWEVIYNTGNGNNDVGIAIIGSESGDIFVTSTTNYYAGGFDDIITYKFCKEHGTLLWSAVYGATDRHDRPVGLGLAPDGHPVMGGWADRIAGSYDLVAVKYDAGALDAPTELTATTVSSSEIALTWADNSSNEDNFVLERRNGAGEWQLVIDTLPANTVSYNDTGLTADHRYTYRVKAFNAADGSSAWSNEANARTTIISYAPPGWQHLYAGAAGGDDAPAAIAAGPDNHPVVTGFTFDAEGEYDYYTLKLDRAAADTVKWAAGYNDDDNESDYATAVAVDSRNRAIVSGFASMYYTGATSNTNDIYTLGYPATGGTPTWHHQYNGPTGNDDRSTAVATAVDGSDNVVVVGYGKSNPPDNDIYVLKYAADGTPTIPLWAASPYNGGGDDQPADVAYDSAGNIFVVGKTWNGSNYDYFVAKYNGSNGSLAWGGAPKRYDGAGHSTDYATALVVDAAGDLYVTGYSVGSGGSGDIVTIKYDGATGTIEPGWPQVHDGGGYDVGVAIGLDANSGEIVVAGTTFVSAGNHDVIVKRYTAGGATVWTRTLDFAGSNESASALALDRSGVACVTAATDSGSGDDIVTVMFDHTGLTVGASIAAGADGGIDYPVDVVFNAFGEAFVAGVTTNAANNTDFLVFKATSTVLQAPYPLKATQLYTEANLSWADNSLDESGFRVEVQTGNCAAAVDADWSPAGVAAANATGFLASGLNAGSPYCFRVQSYNDLGEASRWVAVDVVTAAANPPGNFTATPLNTTDIRLTWDDTTSGESRFNVQWCEGAGCSFPADLQVNAIEVAAEAKSYTFTSACAGQTYRFRINAEKDDRWVSPYATSGEVTTSAVQAPSALASDWVSEAWVELKWQDNTTDESHFIVERCTGAGCSDYADLPTLVSPAGNVLHYRMDEAAWASTPNEVVDLSGAGKHGRAYGSATTTASGKYARAGLFNGTSAYVATPLAIDQASATTTGASFSVWVYPSSTSANNHYVIGTDNGGNDWSLLRNGGTWYVANGSDAGLVNTGVAVTLNAWQHLVVVFNPASGVTLYRNNVNAWSNAAIAFESSSAPVLIGRHGSLSQEFFDGRLDEVAVFNRPLTAAEVGVLYDHGLRRFNDRTVAHSTTYSYRVKAAKTAACGWPSASSAPLQVTTTPPAPGNFLVSASNANRINLFWTDNTTTEAKFVVERCTGAGCVDFSPLPVSISADAISFNDDTVCSNTSYRYRVKAVRDGFWESGYSSEASAATPSLVAPVVTLGTVSEEQISMSWPLNSNVLNGYTVSRCQGDATFCSVDGNYTLQTTKPVLPAGAVLMLPMDEPQWRGTTDEVSDISGSGNHGTAYGGVSTVSGGKTQFGGSFDGVDDYVTTKLNINQGTGTPGVTFEAWIYPTSSSYGQLVISTDNGGSDWGLQIASDRWVVMNGSGTSYPSPDVWISYNNWQHVVVTFHPSSGITVYRNGNEAIGTVSGISLDTSDANVTIGRQGTTSANYFVGRIDNVVVYNRVLSAAEVLARYQSYSHSESGLPANTEFHYRIAPYKTGDCTVAPYTPVTATTLQPPAPSNLTLTAASTTQVNLTWTDRATSETGYRVQWCEGAGCTFPADPTVNAITLGANAQSYVDTSVCEGRTYRYQVRAEKDWVSEASYTWVSPWTTGSVATVAKAEPAADNFTATTLSESQISLAWSDGNADEDGYDLQKCLSNDAASCLVTNDAAFVAMSPSILPALWFKMDETSWGTPVNSAVGGNNATKYDGAVPVSDAVRGQVGRFDGSYDYLSVAHYARINPSKAITVSVWAKSPTTTWNSEHSLLSKRDAYILSPVVGTAHIRFYIYRSGDTWREVYVNPGVDITQWHQYTGVYDGTNLILYVDGVERGRASWPGTINNDTGVLEIGRDDGSSRYLNCWLDDALIFDQALAPAEILALYNNQLLLSPGYQDNGLIPGTTYFYRLRAKKAATCSWPVEWTLKSATTIAPPAPTSLQLTTISTTQVNLAWTDNSGSETGYRVQRCEGTGCTFADVPTAGDSVLLAANTQAYNDTTVKENTSYSFRVRAEKDGAGGWTTAWLGPKSVTTHAKLAPVSLTATRKSETAIDLAWGDSNGDETGFKVERCAGAGCSDFAQIGLTGSVADSVNLVASGTSATGTFNPYVTNVTHPTSGASVRVLAIPNTGSAVASNSAALTTLKTNTNYVVTFEAWCNAGADINLQNDLIPDTLPEFAVSVSTVPKTYRVVFNSSHADMLGTTYLRFFHYNVGRTIYVTNIKMAPPATVTYTDTDSGLLPNTTYSYRVSTYKTATDGVNSWVAGPSNVASATTTVNPPSGLTAIAVNTNEVKLTWTDNTDSETGTEIWRCTGAGCSDFAKIDVVAPNVTTYADVKVAHNTDYRYQVVAKNDGLSAGNGSGWGYYAPVQISPFTAYGYYQLTVPYNGNMRSDFGDLRFYDETAQRQLPYWIKSYTPGGTATVVLNVRKYATINMYYGNPNATDAGNRDDFVTTYEFPGTVIDSTKWVEIDSVNAISQNNGLVLSTTADYNWSKALISKKVFDRQWQWEFYADVTINADTNGASTDNFSLGWMLDQTASAYYSQLVHGLYWSNYTLRYFEKGGNYYIGQNYAASTRYEMKVLLTPTGAQYYIRGGAFTNWTLLATSANYTDQFLRLAVTQYSHNATINSMVVSPGTLPSATLGSSTANVRGSFSYPWSDATSNAASVKTPVAKVPYNLTATVVSDTEVRLSWSDDNAAETGFYLERCLGGSCTNTTLAGSSTSHLVSGLEASKLYTFRVRAYKEAFAPWVTDFSDPVSVAPAPLPATGLTAAPLTKRMIRLNWTDNGVDEDGYEIEVKVWNGRFVKTGEVGANITTYIDRIGIEPGMPFTYRVRPFRGSATALYSNEATTQTTVDLEDGTCIE